MEICSPSPHAGRAQPRTERTLGRPPLTDLESIGSWRTCHRQATGIVQGVGPTMMKPPQLASNAVPQPRLFYAPSLDGPPVQPLSSIARGQILSAVGADDEAQPVDCYQRRMDLRPVQGAPTPAPKHFDDLFARVQQAALGSMIKRALQGRVPETPGYQTSLADVRATVGVDAWGAHIHDKRHWHG